MSDLEEVIEAVMGLIVLIAVAPLILELLSQIDSRVADLIGSAFAVLFIALIVIVALGLLAAIGDAFQR